MEGSVSLDPPQSVQFWDLVSLRESEFFHPHVGEVGESVSEYIRLGESWTLEAWSAGGNIGGSAKTKPSISLIWKISHWATMPSGLVIHCTSSTRFFQIFHMLYRVFWCLSIGINVWWRSNLLLARLFSLFTQETTLRQQLNFSGEL